MSNTSKLDYLKRYMSKDDRHDFKMKQKVKEKILKQQEGGDSPVILDSVSKTSSKNSKSVKRDDKKILKKPAVLKTNKPRHDSDSDTSPPRKPVSAPKRVQRHDSDSDKSPIRRLSPTVIRSKRHDSDPDQSPPRKTASKRHDSDSDQSPPRKTASKRHDSDSDQSPPRKNASKRNDSDSDQSPPRKNSSKKIHDSDSDQSPPRKTARRGDRPSRFASKSPPPSHPPKGDNRKATKTMSGATAGLSSAAEMKREAKLIREKEDKSFKKIGDEVLGRNATTVMRDRDTGKRRNLDAERKLGEEEERKKEEQKAKYENWGKGVSQQQEKEARLADQIHEASKPLARYKDDEDLDTMLRNEERADDPMLAFIRKKKVKEDAKNGKLKPKKELPKYKGQAPPPPNRYNLLPGYRWDGVDRSNGFEAKLFANINNKKAIKEMAYKWSTEDM